MCVLYCEKYPNMVQRFETRLGGHVDGSHCHHLHIGVSVNF